MHFVANFGSEPGQLGSETVRIARQIIVITFGSLITALGINDLLIPGHLMSGGLTGISIILYHFAKWPVATTYFIMNVPLLLLAYRYISHRFTILTVYSVVVLTVFLAVIHIHKYTSDPLLSAIFGGVVAGAGSALILRAGGSSGGVDVVTRIVAKYKSMNIGRLSLVLNGLIILACAFLFNVQTAMYTLISIFTSAKMYEVILNHVDRRSVIIVTERGNDVAKRIVSTMQRGVTLWNASGAYTDTPKQVLLCVIVNVQLNELKNTVLKEDPTAFLAVIPTHQVVGQFTQIW